MHYFGVVLLMAIESACIPLPSEIIMPFSGYLVFRYPERFNLFLMGVAGAVGCVVGSIVAYYAGKYGGRPLVEKYGKYVLIRHKDLDKAEQWFAKHGDKAIFFSRLMPVVRTFISFPAGVAEMNVPRFVAYTFIGSLPWCYALAFAGMKMGEQWASLRKYFHGADKVIAVFIVLGLAFYIYHHVKPETADKSR
jgi:membrane protein DedA with SNARE-associated domain